RLGRVAAIAVLGENRSDLRFKKRDGCIAGRLCFRCLADGQNRDGPHQHSADYGKQSSAHRPPSKSRLRLSTPLPEHHPSRSILPGSPSPCKTLVPPATAAKV